VTLRCRADQHKFNGTRAREARAHRAGGWRLTVSDQGRGLPDNFDIDQSKGFGMQVVKAFVRRLDATVTVSSRPGHTAFEIRNVAG